MKPGASYLRYAAAAVFLAAAAWTLAFFIGREQSPETVRAEQAEVRISIVAEGTVWRRETVIVCDGDGAYLAAKQPVYDRPLNIYEVHLLSLIHI